MIKGQRKKTYGRTLSQRQKLERKNFGRCKDNDQHSLENGGSTNIKR